MGFSMVRAKHLEPPIRDLKAQGVDVSEIVANAPSHWPIDGPFWRGWKPRISPMIELKEVTGLTITGVTIRNSPGWTVHTLCCDKVRIDGITIDNHLFGPNTDGLDINGCRDVTVSNCRITCCDDAIILKATKDARSCERIAVSNCVLKTNCAALGLGAETTSGIRDISMTGCVVEQAIRMIQLEMWEPGIIENVCISNISGRVMADEDIPMEKVIYCDIQQHLRDEPILGKIRNVVISNITAVTRGRIVLTAQDGASIDNITIRDVHMIYPEIEDSSELVKTARSSQNSNYSPETRGRNAAVVADNVTGLWLQNVQAQMPSAGDNTIAMHGAWLRNVSDSMIDCPWLTANKSGHADAKLVNCTDLDIRGLGSVREEI